MKSNNKKYINHIKPNQEMKIKTELTDKQIELIADLFSKREQFFIPDDDEVNNEWILSHAFQLGAKFYRDFKQLSDEGNN